MSTYRLHRDGSLESAPDECRCGRPAFAGGERFENPDDPGHGYEQCARCGRLNHFCPPLSVQETQQ